MCVFTGCVFLSVSFSWLDFLKITTSAYYPRLGIKVSEGAECVQGTLTAFQVQRFPSHTLPFFHQNLFSCLFICFLTGSILTFPIFFSLSEIESGQKSSNTRKK